MAVRVTPSGVYLEIVEDVEGALPQARALAPGRMEEGAWVPASLDGEPNEVRAAAGRAWTEEAVAAFRAEQETMHEALAADLAVMPLPAISDVQFFQALALRGFISEEEAEDAVSIGAIPAIMQAVIDAQPAAERFAIRMKIKGETVFSFEHPLVALFAASQGMDEAATREFWRFAAGL